MDPQVVEQVGKVLGIAHASKDAITDVAKRLFGPALDKAGEKLADYFFKKESDGAIRVLIDATALLRDADQEPNVVPHRLLIPLLRSAGLEDDPDLARKWSALLANAASRGVTNKILPGFVEILRQLTSDQAEILDWMFAMRSEPVPGWISHWPDVPRADIETKFKLSGSDYALLISDMERLQLIEPRRPIERGKKGVNYPMDQMLDLVVDRWNSRVKTWLVFSPKAA